MLRQLAATFRPLLQQHHHNQLQLHSAIATRTSQCFHSSTSAQGLEEFFETPLQEGDKPRTGKDWKAADLRRKSWDDLHKLWYVLLKERNMLASEQGRRKARGEKLPNPTRTTKVCFKPAWSAQATEQRLAQAVSCAFVLSTAVSKADVRFLWRSQAWVSAVLQVKKSMARIKLVLTERAIAITDPVQSQAMRAMINS